jgi:hypothetical protein
MGISGRATPGDDLDGLQGLCSAAFDRQHERVCAPVDDRPDVFVRRVVRPEQRREVTEIDGIAVIEPDLHRCDSRVAGDIVGTEHVESNVSETVVGLLDEQHPPLIIRKEYFG